MKEIFIATNNKGKARDFEALFQPLGIEVKTLADLPEMIDVEETGVTFEENAILKAEEIAQRFNTFVIADDSGLEVDALNGEPGVYSARYAGEAKDDEANIDKVLTQLENVPTQKRTARFRCALAVAAPGIETVTIDGSCEGLITTERIGTEGFGYDPIFYVPKYERTMAQMTAEEKGKISHRGQAIKKLRPQLAPLLKEARDAK